jgi:hypothetical protein
MRQLARSARSLVAVVLVLGFVAEVQASFLVPRGILAQRRGRTFRIPQPTTVDSSPTIASLTRVLSALGATDRDYGGHRKKAVTHIATAIQYLETPASKGKSNDAIAKAEAGQAPVPTKTATTPEAASDESLRKAKTLLFTIHHQLADHAATRGQLAADAQVRIAIDEITTALKPSTPTTTPTPTTPTPPVTAKAAAPPSAARTPAPTTGTGRPAR